MYPKDRFPKSKAEKLPRSARLPPQNLNKNSSQKDSDWLQNITFNIGSPRNLGIFQRFVFLSTLSRSLQEFLSQADNQISQVDAPQERGGWIISGLRG